MSRNNNNLLAYLFVAVTGVFSVGCLLSSCGKTTILPPASNILYQVVNLSPDLLPVDLYIDLAKKNTVSFSYPTPSGYFGLTSIDPPFLIRSSSPLISTANILSIPDTLRNNMRYTLFITGLRNNVRPQDSVTYIFTRDTASAATAGRGKIRFVNASPGSGGLDITANGTTAFANQVYKNVSKFIEVPAGNYDFRIYPTGITTTLLSDLPGITVQDGKLYTLYCRGVIGRTDSAAFGSAVIANKP